MSEPRPEPKLEKVIGESSVVICAGAGGVGKTTVAAAISIMAAEQGRKVACLAIDPARRLATNLGFTTYKRDNVLHDISDHVGLGANGGRLSFGMLSPKELFDDIVRTRSTSEQAAQKIFDNMLYKYVSNSLAGVHEYMALEKLRMLQEDPSYDLIVVDTPPTSNAVDFFTAPRRVMEALDGKLVKIMRRAYRGAQRSGFDIVGKWAAIVFRTLSRFTGTELLAELMAFIDALSELFGSFAERAAEVDKVLRAPEVKYCLVLAPDEGTYRETAELRRKLLQLGLSVDAVVFNRSHWPRAEEPPAEFSEAVQAELAELGAEWNRAGDQESRFVEDVLHRWKDLDAVGIVPILPEGANRVESLRSIGGYLL